MEVVSLVKMMKLIVLCNNEKYNAFYNDFYYYWFLEIKFNENQTVSWKINKREFIS